MRLFIRFELFSLIHALLLRLFILKKIELNTKKKCKTQILSKDTVCILAFICRSEMLKILGELEFNQVYYIIVLN
jgi:hypothetical protein